MDPREQILEAIRSGAGPEEVAVLVQENLEALGNLRSPQYKSFLREVDELGESVGFPDLFGSIIREEISTNFEEKLRSGEIEVLTGEGPIGGLGRGVSGMVIRENGKVISEAAKNNPLLMNAIRKVGSLAFGGGPKARWVKRVGWASAAMGFFQGNEDERPEGEQFGQTPTTTTIPGQQPGPTAPTSQAPQMLSPGSGDSGADRAMLGRFGGSVVSPTGSLIDPGFNIMVVDHDGSLTGTPGAIAVVSSQDMGVNDGGLDPAMLQQIASTGTTDATSFLADYLNKVPQARGSREVHQVLFPNTVGQVTMNTPVQVQPKGPRKTTPGPVTKGNLFDDVLPGGTPLESLLGGDTPTNVPAGARLSPNAFQNYHGRTLVEWAQNAAVRHGVPLNLLYGIVDHESGWLSTAVGDNGNSFGLAQIYLPAWGGKVSQSQALNPIFALEWTARKLKERFNTFGTWEAAVAAHNNPSAAAYLAENGSFLDKKSANYVSSVIGRAMSSGLSQHLYNDPGMLDITGDAAGPTFSPFQAPDPAQSREFLRDLYQEMLGRDPTEAELNGGVDRVNSFAKMAYNANIRKLKGQESEEVDVGSRMSEEIRGLGEFDFHQENVEQRRFTDYAAGIARMMQSGI